jgi:hypothetical protein
LWNGQAEVTQSVECRPEKPVAAGSNPALCTSFNCGLAQLVEHLTLTQDVAGSIPASTASSSPPGAASGRAATSTDHAPRTSRITALRLPWRQTVPRGPSVRDATSYRRLAALMIAVFHGGCSLVGRAPDCDSGRRRFESDQSPQFSIHRVPMWGCPRGQRARPAKPSIAGSNPARHSSFISPWLSWKSATLRTSRSQVRALQAGPFYAARQVTGWPPLTAAGAGRRALHLFRGVGKWHAACFGSRSSGVRFTPPRPLHV